ncbi:MAG TPA: OmpA family protein [Polyangia bacterium]|jgi:chemotaxis protein MotB|nr:OmpA family protein [Polyangia bacterium]
MNHVRIALFSLVPLAAGCVSTGAYNRKVADLTSQQDQLKKEGASREKQLKDQIADLEKQLGDLKAQLGDLKTQLTDTGKERDDLKKQLDDSTALVGELKKRLEKLGQNVDKLTSEKGELAKGLDDAKERLEELRRQQAAAEARAATFRKLVEKLRSMIDAGQLKVVIREGRMLIALPNDVLFDSGKTSLKPDGQAALRRVADVLATINDRHFQVAGHTDDVPIKTPRFPSNWELSTARAIEVTNLLITSGVRAQLLSAAGYGEFDPVAPNDSPDHRAQNRRIEIVLQPNLSDLPLIEEPKAKG